MWPIIASFCALEKDRDLQKTKNKANVKILSMCIWQHVSWPAQYLAVDKGDDHADQYMVH